MAFRRVCLFGDFVDRSCHHPAMADNDGDLYASHPELGLLLPQGSAVVSGALGESMTLQGEVRPVQVRFVPGRVAVVQYSASISHDGRSASMETLVASIGQVVPDGVSVVSAHGIDVAVWRASEDPFLPGLRSVSNAKSAGLLLDQLGIEATEVKTRRRAYRPGRRAVVELQTPTDRVFAKVVRPHRVADLQQLHTYLAQRAPIPKSLGWSEESGLAVLQALRGHPLREAITADGHALPSPASLAELLKTLEHADTGNRSRPTLVERVHGHAAFIATITPDLSTFAHRIAESIEQLATPEPKRTIHGDFHASQVMADRSFVIGMVDIDTVGSGEPTDDLANFLAHLDAIASAQPGVADRVSRYGVKAIRVFDTMTDPRQLRVRVAAALLGYARGPFRVQEPEWRTATNARLVRADHWLTAATAMT